MAASFYARTVREELAVSNKIDRAIGIHPLVENIFDAAKWRIAREPNCGTPMDEVDGDRRVLNLPPNKVAKSPGLLVRYFQESQDTVVIDWIHFYPYDDSIAVYPSAYIR